MRLGAALLFSLFAHAGLVMFSQIPGAATTLGASGMSLFGSSGLYRSAPAFQVTIGTANLPADAISPAQTTKPGAASERGFGSSAGVIGQNGSRDAGAGSRLAPPSESVSIPLPGTVYYRLSELDERPQIQTQTEPEFPLHVDPGVVGSVVLKLLIDQNGLVEDAIVVSSQPEGVFDVAAVSAFKKASFLPGKKAGKSVKTQLAIEVVFESRPFR